MVSLIEAVDVSKRFAGGLGRESTLALAGLSLAIHADKPSIIAVVGESGSGKTTLARLLLGLRGTSRKFRYDDGRQNAQDDQDQEKFDQREAVVASMGWSDFCFHSKVWE